MKISKRGIHWDLYDWYKIKCPKSYAELRTIIEAEISNQIQLGKKYIFSQQVAAKVQPSIYVGEVPLPRDFINSIAGVELYVQINSLPDWNFYKANLKDKDYSQTIYFKDNN